jgi:hypothetical protein
MTLNEMNLISNDYFSKIAMKFDTKDKGRKDIEIDYYNMHAKGLLKHKKELQEIEERFQANPRNLSIHSSTLSLF